MVGRSGTTEATGAIVLVSAHLRAICLAMAVSSVYRSGSPRLPAFTAARCAVTWDPRGSQEVMEDEGQLEKSKWCVLVDMQPSLASPAAWAPASPP